MINTCKLCHQSLDPCLDASCDEFEVLENESDVDYGSESESDTNDQDKICISENQSSSNGTTNETTPNEAEESLNTLENDTIVMDKSRIKQVVQSALRIFYENANVRTHVKSEEFIPFFRDLFTTNKQELSELDLDELKIFIFENFVKNLQYSDYFDENLLEDEQAFNKNKPKLDSSIV